MWNRFAQATPRIGFSKVDLTYSDLTATGVDLLAPVLARSWAECGLLEIKVSFNPTLGETGVAALARALPKIAHSLQKLFFSVTGCGDDGLEAMAATLPTLAKLTLLSCGGNEMIGPRGCRLLAAALPPTLEELYVDENRGMLAEGATALAAAVPRCPRLRLLDCSGSGLQAGRDEVCAAFQRAGLRESADGAFIFQAHARSEEQ